MNENLLTLCLISTHITSPQIAVLTDGEHAVEVDRDNLRDWCKRSGLDTPIFAKEIDKHMLEEWKFAFSLGSKLTEKELARASMSKPHDVQHRTPKNSWGSSITPCSVQCKKCLAIYPIYGKFVLNETEVCFACNYKYTFCDW